MLEFNEILSKQKIIATTMVSAYIPYDFIETPVIENHIWYDIGCKTSISLFST